MSGFAWTKERKLAAELLATTSLTPGEISKQVGISPMTLARWRQVPEFRERLAELEAAAFGEAERLPYARRADRIRLLSEMANRLLDVAKARSELTFGTERETDEYVKQGGRSGMITVRQKMLGSGEFGVLVTEYNVDATLTKEIRATLLHLAEELGQRGQLDVDAVQGQIVVRFAERDDGPQ